MPLIHFGSGFTGFKNTKVIPLKNDSSRPIKWLFRIESDYSDVFLVDPSSGVILARSTVLVRVVFKPEIEVDYSSSGLLIEDDGSLSNSDELQTGVFVALTGTGVDPKQLQVVSLITNFGVVGLDDPEYRTITIINPTSKAMKIQVKSDNTAFSFNTDIFDILPYATIESRVIFKPLKITANKQMANIELLLLADGLESSEDVPPQSFAQLVIEQQPAQLQRLHQINYEGLGGIFEFTIKGSDPDVVLADSGNADPVRSSQELNRSSTKKIDHSIDKSKITVNFVQLQPHVKTKKEFLFTNSGDTALSFITTLVSGDFAVEGSVYKGVDGGVMFSLSPVQCEIAPRSEISFIVTVEVSLVR